jgi:hypothetical protein
MMEMWVNKVDMVTAEVQIEESLLDYITICHKDVATYRVGIRQGDIIVAVMLRPIYGRNERLRVLGEVADEVARQYDARARGDACDVYVVADIDVYQDLLKGAPIDPKTIAKRNGCYRLRVPRGG